ncbi:MAG: hypothetical protein JSW41_04630, partial [Candidatus Aenigmatarchaeota archaeon]
RQGLKSNLKRLELVGEEKPKALESLQEELNKLEGITFISSLTDNSMEVVKALHEDIAAFDWDNATPEEALRTSDNLLNQLGTFSHMRELFQILKQKRKKEGDMDLIPLLEKLEPAVEAVDHARADILDIRMDMLKRWYSKTTLREQTEDEVDQALKEVVDDTQFLDRHGLALHDSSDRLLNVMGKKLKVLENVAHNKWYDYLRGAGKKRPGLSKLTTELIKAKGTSDVTKLYEDFIVWDTTRKKKRYKFIVEEGPGATNAEMKRKWRALQAMPKSSAVRRFYDHAIVPYLEQRKDLSAQGLESILGDWNNIPIRKKQSSETNVGSVEWAARKLRNLKDEFKVQADDIFVGAVDEEGNPIRFIPYRYNYKGELEKKDISLEIANGLAFAMENIFEGNEKRKALPLVEAIEHTLANRDKFRIDPDGTRQREDNRSGMASNAYEKFNTMANMFFYGKEDTEVTLGGKDLRKTVRTARKGLSFLNLGFNLASQIVNPIVQSYFIFSQGVGGRDYTLTDLRKGYAMAMKKMPGMISDYHSKNPTSKDTLLMERLGVFSHGLEEINLGKKGNFFNNFMTKLGYAGFKLGNAMVQPGVAYAMMMKKKIPGTDTSFYDAWRMEDGSLVLDPKAEQAMGGEEEVALFMAQVQNAVRKVSDNRALSDKGAAEAHWLGKFIMMHRGWMMPMWMNMWKANHFNELTGRWEQGFMRTAADALWKLAKGENNGLLQLKNLVFQFGNISTKDINPATGEPFTEDQLAMYKANIKQAVTMTYAFLLLTLLKNFGWDDEEKKDSYAYYLSLRIKGEILTMLDPKDFLRITQSPSAAVNNIDHLLTLVNSSTIGLVTGESLERLEKGAYKDWTKLERDWSRFVPVYNQYLNLQKTADKIKFMEKY